MATKILNTQGSFVTKNAAQLEDYDIIRYSADNPSGQVTIQMSGSGTADLSDELGAAPAYIVGSSGANNLTTGSGDDTVYGGGGNDTLNGGGGDDVLYGENGNDSISGGDGNDWLDGGAGSDKLYGGNGADTITDVVSLSEKIDIDGGAGDDLITAYLNDSTITGTIDGGTGTDTLRVGSYLANVLIKNVEILETGGSSVTGTVEQFESFDKITVIDSPDYDDSTIYLTVANGGALDLSNEIGNRNAYISASEFGNTITTGGGNDYLYGGNGNDALNGGDGDDILDGGYGNDTLKGGNGNDTITDGYYYRSDETVDIDGGAGNDQINLPYSYYNEGLASGTVDGGSGTDTLRAVGNLANVVIKNIEILETWGNTVTGTVEQFESFDKITVIDSPDYDNSTIYLTVANGGALDLSNEIGNRNAYISASEFGNTITTGGGNDYLYGGNGNDALNGGDGDDILDGGYGNDTLKGGNGNDTITDGYYYRSDETVDIDGGAGNDQINLPYSYYNEGLASGTVDGGSGTDTLRAAGNLANVVIKNIEILETGGNTVTGTVEQFESFNKITVIDTPDYDDFMVYLSAANGGALDLSDELGNRKVSITASEFGNTITTGGGDDGLYGGNGEDTLNGGNGNDLMDGGSGNDTLSGADGDDILDGGYGNDTLRGGNGNDTITDGYYYASDETVDIDGGAGNDQINLPYSYYFDGLASGTVDGGSGTDTLRAAGNLANVVIKNIEILETGGNTITGTVKQFESFNKITVIDTPDYDDFTVYLSAANGGALDLSDELGNRNASITASEFGNTITTGGGNDYLFGSAGNDTLNGGAGDDYFSGGGGVDTIVFKGVYANFAIDRDAGTVKSAALGSDRVDDVDFARFDNGTYDFATGIFTEDGNTAPAKLRIGKTVVSEDTPQWTTLTTIGGFDAEGDALSFRLADSANGQFVIRGNRLITAKTFDYETKSSYDIVIEASDGKATTQKTFTIAVKDVYEAPVNTAPTDLALSRSKVKENAAAGTSVGLFSAKDAEGQPIKWSLLDDAGHFKLTGNKLQVRSPVDYEETSSLTIKVQATDSQGLSTVKDFTVGVINLPDGNAGAIAPFADFHF